MIGLLTFRGQPAGYYEGFSRKVNTPVLMLYDPAMEEWSVEAIEFVESLKDDLSLFFRESGPLHYRMKLLGNLRARIVDLADRPEGTGAAVQNCEEDASVLDLISYVVQENFEESAIYGEGQHSRKCYPFSSAAYLLPLRGLSEPDDNGVLDLIRNSNEIKREIVLNEGRPRPVWKLEDNLTHRHVTALVAGGFEGKTRRAMDKKKADFIASRILESLYLVVTDADLVNTIIGPNHEVVPDAPPRHVARAEGLNGESGCISQPEADAPNESLLLVFAEGLVKSLDHPAAGYPKHLTPSALAPAMTVTPVRHVEVEVAKRHDQSRLYAGTPTAGGVNALDLLKQERRAVLLGDPGGGKSSLLAASVIEEVRGQSNNLAVKCRLSDLAVMLDKRRRKSKPLRLATYVKLIIRCTEREAELLLGSERDDLVELLSGSPKALIALDGLDEVPGHLRGIVMHALAALDELPGRLVLSSRRLGYQPVRWHALKEFSVDRLSPRQSRAFLDEWFRGRLNGTAHRGAIGAITGVHAASGQVPVLLGIIAIVAGEPGSVPSTPSELYDKYLDVFLQRRWDPPESEPTADELEIQKAVARQIAWSMALGGSREITSSRWTDVLSVARLNRAVEHANRPIAASLYETAGLLVAHGSTLYKGAQEVRWLHRTLHEYLVGIYLAELYLDDLDRWKVNFSYILQTRGAWEVAVQFMIGSLRPEHHARVFDHARVVRKVGDPGCVTLSMMAQMARMTPPGSLLRRQTAADLAAEGMWQLAGELHRETQRRLYLTALEDPARRVATLLETLRDSLSLDAEIVRELRRAVSEVPSSSVGLIFKIIDTVYWWSPDDGLAMAVDAVLRGLPWGLWVRIVGIRPSDSSVRHALAALADVPQDLVNFLAYIGVDLLEYSADFPWISAHEVAREAEPIPDELFDVPEGRWAEMFSPRLPSAIQRRREYSMLSGTYGAYSAFKASQILSANEKHYMRVPVSEWAILGRRIKLLRSRRGFDHDSLEFRMTFDEGFLLRIDVHQVHELTQILDFIAAWIILPDEVPMRTLLRFCLALNDRATSESGAPREALIEMRDLVLGEVCKLPQEAIAALLVTDSKPWISVFGGPRGRRFQYALWNHKNVTEDEIRAVVAWAAIGGLDVISGLRVPERPSEWLTILEMNGTMIEQLPPSSRFTVAKWLATEGTLAEWRRRLVSAPDWRSGDPDS